MKKRNERILRMMKQIESIIEQARKLEKKYKDKLENVHPNYRASALNLIHYRALRKNDIRPIQKKLGNLGLSRLARAESHVLASLMTNKAILRGLAKGKKLRIPRADFSIKKGNRFIKTNAKNLLGYRSKGRRTRIMVTLPSEAADDFQLVHSMLAAGMNCARINCAHDDPDVWKKMIDNIRKASKRLKKKCKISMDLGGPKIRTGAIQPGPKIVHFQPERDVRGRVTHPALLWLGPEPHFDVPSKHIPLKLEDIIDLKLEEKLYFEDTRHKKRSLLIKGKEENGLWAHCFDAAYLEAGNLLYKDKNDKSTLIVVGDIPALEQRLILNVGDTLLIHRTPIPGEPARYDEQGNLLSEAHISCTAPDVFDQVLEGELILFDDGKIEGVINRLDQEEMQVSITYAKQRGGKLRADKGINFPSSQLQLRGLTDKDRQDLKFVAKYADVVNMSFVNSDQDVCDLIDEIERLGAIDKLGIILKIETQIAFNYLIPILLEGMRIHQLGVMIARGDLAVECGWNNIGRIQEEILSICQAAHIPDVWATQVLENLAKKGIPSRAEITDAAMAQRAECVMLNKGHYILQAIRLLDSILKEMEPYRDKKASLSPPLKRANR